MRVLLVVLILCCVWYSTQALGMKLSKANRLQAGSLNELASTECTDIPPSKQFTCYQQAILWGKCKETFMTGYCLKSCGRCKPNSGTVKPGLGATPTPSLTTSPSLQQLKITLVAGNNQYIPAPLNVYNSVFTSNKNKLYLALTKGVKVLSPDASPALASARVRLGLSVAMLETNTFSPNDRDKTKTGMSTNYSQFNFNQDMLVNYLKMSSSQLSLLNDMANVELIALTFLRAIQVLGVDGFLNFHRGGRTAYQDGVSYGAAHYRQVIASMVATIDSDANLLTDNRRIDIDAPHVLLHISSRTW